MRLQPRITAEQALEKLVQVRDQLANLGLNPPIGAYVRWAAESERLLRWAFVEPDLAEDLYTTRFWQLFNWQDSGALMVCARLKATLPGSD